LLEQIVHATSSDGVAASHLNLRVRLRVSSGSRQVQPRGQGVLLCRETLNWKLLRSIAARPDPKGTASMILEWQSSAADWELGEWVTLAAYLFAASLSARAARSASLTGQARDVVFWRVSAVILLVLGVNEILDLQTLLTSIGRAYAKANGWYGDHRRLQYVSVLALGAAAVFAGIALLWLTAGAHGAVRLALAGLAFIGLFAMSRAASFHHLDELLRYLTPVVSWHRMLEMTGILIIPIAATLYTRDHRTNG
jgi:hypothetical protein